ncbi:MAG: hypothetical protein E6729_07605 [Finegoldia magna]|nr:hypothetical protein [Finegoldia magna]
MENLKLERVEIKDNSMLLDGKFHIENYAFVNEVIMYDSEKIENALKYFDSYLLSWRIWDMLNEKNDKELDFDERVVEDMLYDMCFNIKNISNLELRKKIEECILKLYENEDIIQINNVLLYLDDNYESDDYANLEEVYTLDMYLSHDIKDIKLRFFNYEQLLEIHKGLKNDVDVRLYANPKYHWSRMAIIREALENYGIDVSKYVEAGFTEKEIDEIRKGLENGVDVSIYADIYLHHDEMREIREKLEEGKKVYELRYDKSQLNIIINALEEAKTYYEQHLFDSYDNFDELEKIIKNLKDELPHKLW